MKTREVELISTPKTNFEAHHAITEHWISDLDFYDDELNFLDGLIDKYIGLMMHEEHRERIRKMTVSFAEIQKHHRAMFEKAPEHLKHLSAILMNPFSHEEHMVIDEHHQLEEYMTAFVKSFRAVKREIFNITKHVLREEKLKKYTND